ncbi:cytoskeleton-associated protein 2-like isoform X1 [Frankliniella occidentalis]|uniref:Cytoskeleton-associated protein 2-like isoform X1 n=1 Tax=Frankliniella occidentalis TaxID=133901 RepID=A0A6J1SIQ0_FRAOC|nr:cytoskeleton-associated protein 2-like isoform X1 [Frankliniella occidentalis]
MTPTITRQAKNTGMKSRQVQAKVTSRFASFSVNAEEQVRQFREARKARETERLEKLRDSRLKNSSAAASTVSASISITSFASSSCPPSKPRVLGVLLNKSQACSTTIKSSALSQRSQPCQRTTHHLTETSSNNNPNAATKCMPALNLPTKRTAGVISSLKSRRSNGGRQSLSKKRPDLKLSNKAKRKVPKAEVKLTKTAQLRMMKCDPLLDLSQFKRDSNKRIVLPLPASVPKPGNDSKNAKAPIERGDIDVTTSVIVDGSNLGIQNNDQAVLIKDESQRKTSMKKKSISDPSVKKSISLTCDSPSHIPRLKTSFVSPLRKTVPSTPRPSPLRARLAEWLEKRDHSLDNFKHLKCFGVLGPVVKRPQTPFRKAILSTSTLRAIPESSESTSLNEKVEDTYEEDDIGLNSTFTLEDEDKENICGGFETQMQVQNTTVGNLPLSPNTQRIKDLDQAHGVLSELHRLIKMAYPTEQCGLWLKAIRRRFPQCGEEPIYWECLASLEEIRGDFESAVACYERAILQGAESCVQSSLDQLHQKMSDLHIEPIPSTNMNNVKRTQNNLPQSKNIIKSSSIQFAVHEKCGSSKKTVIDENKADPVFTATPVRRSMRLAGTPSKGTPGITCVRSLEFLEPKIKNSLIFHGNSALDPNEMKC